MSLHLIECVRPLQLSPSSKLVLLAFADSADEETKIAFPGFAAVQQWANVSRSRAFEIVNDLEEAGYLRKHHGGHRGRRAEYVVFPRGCCALHPAPAATIDDDAGDVGPDLATMDQDSIDRLRAALLEHDSKGPTGRTQSAQKGSGSPDSTDGKGSDQPDPSLGVQSERVLPAGPNSLKGSGLGPAHRTPSLATTTTPPTPHASGAGGACPAHQTPAENCRGCGTTPRQLRKAAERDAAVAAAGNRGPRCPQGTPWSADGTCGCPPHTHPLRHELEQARSA